MDLCLPAGLEEAKVECRDLREVPGNDSRPSIPSPVFQNPKDTAVTKEIAPYSPFTIQMTFLSKTDRAISTFILEHKKPQIAKAILSSRNTAPGGITASDFKLSFNP